MSHDGIAVLVANNSTLARRTTLAQLLRDAAAKMQPMAIYHAPVQYNADVAIDAFIAARTAELVGEGIDYRVAPTLACHELFEHVLPSN